MAYYRFQLQAGVPFRATVAGRVILIDDLGGASGLDITPNYGGRDLPTMPDRKKAFKFMEPFDGVTLKAAVNCNVGVFLSASDVSLGFADGANVNVAGGVSILNDANARIPVNVDGGVINVTASVQSFTNIVHKPAVVVGKTAAVVAVNDASLKRLRFRNTSATAMIALGGAGVGMDSPIILEPGAVYFEDDAAGAQWYALSDQDNASLTIIGLK